MIMHEVWSSSIFLCKNWGALRQSGSFDPQLLISVCVRGVYLHCISVRRVICLPACSPMSFHCTQHDPPFYPRAPQPATRSLRRVYQTSACTRLWHTARCLPRVVPPILPTHALWLATGPSPSPSPSPPHTPNSSPPSSSLTPATQDGHHDVGQGRPCRCSSV